MEGYRVIRSARRTLSLQVTREGEVVVRAPRNCSRGWIEGFVESHRDWIAKRQQLLARRRAEMAAFRLHTGDQIMLCGREIPVELRPGSVPALSGDRLILPSGEPGDWGNALLALWRKQGLPLVKARLTYWANIMGLSFRVVKISSAKCRWGSCTRDGVIRISVYLLFAPLEGIDYVLVHELSHRKQMNHSPAFWSVVERTMPDYRARRQLLRQFQEEPLLQSLARPKEKTQ